jgi:hypothetical protein
MRSHQARGTSVTAKEKSQIPPAKLALYERLIATNPRIERKGATVPYTSHSGHMFTYLYGAGALRLPEEEREKFLRKYRTSLVVSYGGVMKEYVAVPDSLLQNTRDLKKYLDLSYDYVRTLKPKRTKKARAGNR